MMAFGQYLRALIWLLIRLLESSHWFFAKGERQEGDRHPTPASAQSPQCHSLPVS